MNTTNALSDLVAALRQMRERARQQRELTGLNDYALRDLGLSRAQVIAELDTPLWR